MDISQLFTNLQVFFSLTSFFFMWIETTMKDLSYLWKISIDQVNSLAVILIRIVTWKLWFSSFGNNDQTINLIKKYLSQKRCVFHRSFDSRKKNLKVCEQLRYIQLPNFTEFTPQIFFQIFLGCLQTYSLFLYINRNYDEKRIYFVEDIFWSD